MSQMQLGLVAIGVVIILAVVLYNQWSARRSAPLRSAVRGAGDGANGPTQDLADGLLDTAGRKDPVLDAVHPDGFATLPLTQGTTLLDPLIDVITPLTLEHVVSGDAVLAVLPGSRRVGTKPFYVEGQTLQDAAWEVVRPGQRYSALQVGVQLANRMGPLNEIEFSEFVMKVQAFADALSAGVDFPDMMQEVARARELDQFASAHDAMLGFTLRAQRVAWSPGFVTQHAAQQGFVAGSLPGRMVLPASVPGGAPVLVLQFETQAALADDPEQTALREFQLTLDVPHVPRSEQPFVRMREISATLAQGMEGIVTDGGTQSLNRDSLDGIGAELDAIYDALQQRDLAAGSVLARRLFS